MPARRSRRTAERPWARPLAITLRTLLPTSPRSAVPDANTGATEEQKFVQKTGGWTVDFDKASEAAGEAPGEVAYRRGNRRLCHQPAGAIGQAGKIGQAPDRVAQRRQSHRSGIAGRLPRSRAVHAHRPLLAQEVPRQGGHGRDLDGRGRRHRPAGRAQARCSAHGPTRRSGSSSRPRSPASSSIPASCRSTSSGVDENGQPYYVMKFIQGRTLKDVIEEYHADATGRRAEGPGAARCCRCSSTSARRWPTRTAAASSTATSSPTTSWSAPTARRCVLDWGLAKVDRRRRTSPAIRAPVQLSYHGRTDGDAGRLGQGDARVLRPGGRGGHRRPGRSAQRRLPARRRPVPILTGKPPRQAKKMKRPARAWPGAAAADAPRQLDTDDPQAARGHLPEGDGAPTRRTATHGRRRLAEDVQRYLAGEPVSAYRESLAERGLAVDRRNTVRQSAGRRRLLVVRGNGLDRVLLSSASSSVAGRSPARRESQRDADRLKNEEQARQEIITFRNLAEEARFYAAKASPLRRIRGYSI